VTELCVLALGKEQPEERCVVRLHTSSWLDARGLHTKKSLTFLKRQCVGYNVLQEDALNIDAESVVNRIVNLYTCPDGVYQVAVCNQARDWEMGYVEDYDYELLPLTDQPPSSPSYRGRTI
jgi:hypothetical protein